MNSGVYQIINIINGNSYIGSSKDLTRRERDHFLQLSKKMHANKHLQRSYNRYGPKKFVFEILLYCMPQDNIFFEQRAMDVLKPKFNNRKKADSNLGIKIGPFSKKHKKNLSLSHLGQRAWNTGIPMSENAKQKMIEANKGSIPWNKGKKIGPSEKRGKTFEEMFGLEKAAQLKKEHSEKVKGKPAWNKGIPASEESKQKLRESHLGKPAWNSGIRTGKPAWNRGKKMGPSNKKGKTFEELYSPDKAQELKKQQSERMKNIVPWNKGKTLEELHGVEKAKQLREQQSLRQKGWVVWNKGKKIGPSEKRGKTYEDMYGAERAQEIKEKVSYRFREIE